MGSRVRNRISFRGNSPCRMLPTGASRKLSGHLKHLDRVSADEFAVQILQREITDLIMQNELLRQGSETERRSQHYPVVAEISESNGLVAGNGIRHELTDPDRLAQNGVVAAVPEVIAIGVLQRSERQSRLVVHEPRTVSAVLRLHGKVQADDIIVSKSSGSNTDLGSRISVEDTGGFMETAAVDETVVLGPAEVSAKTGCEVILDAESGVIDEILIQLYKYGQLMTADFADSKIIDPVINGDQAALFHKLRQVIRVLGIEGVVATIGMDHSGHAPEQTLLGERLLHLFAKGSGQRVGAVGGVVAGGQAIILTGTASAIR